MGSDKSLLPIYGARFIDHLYRTLEALFEEVIIVTNSVITSYSIHYTKLYE